MHAWLAVGFISCNLGVEDFDVTEAELAAIQDDVWKKLECESRKKERNVEPKGVHGLLG